MDERKPVEDMTKDEAAAELEPYVQESFNKHVEVDRASLVASSNSLFVFALKNLPRRLDVDGAAAFMCDEEHRLYTIEIDESKMDEAREAAKEAQAAQARGETAPYAIPSGLVSFKPLELPPFTIPEGVLESGETHVDVKRPNLEFLLSWIAMYDILGEKPTDEDIGTAARVFTLMLNTFFDVEEIDEQVEGRADRQRPYLRDKSVMVTTDPIAGALFDPGRSDYIDPIQWWDEAPKKIRSSKYGVVGLQLRLPTSIELEGDAADYRLTAKQRFWYETAEKLAREGYRTIRGVDLLKKRGYTNPYRSMDTMKEAGLALYDLTARQVAIDTTDQYSKKHRGDTRPKLKITLRPIIDGEYSFTVWDGGDEGDLRDFEIELRGNNPVEAFATLEYQLEHKMFADIPGYDDCLDGMRKITAEHRYMWNEVRRRMLEKNLQGDGKNGARRIRFDTLFKTLGMDGTEKKDADQRRHMIDTLEKMLRRACRDDHKKGTKTVKHTRLFKSWRYITENGRRYGVEITPL